jgi:hypothetical protein
MRQDMAAEIQSFTRVSL